MKCLVSCAGVAIVAMTTSIAFAQPTPAGVARAVSLFDEAKRELDAGNVERACGLFVDSYRSDPQVGTLLNTALCHERAGKTASAWAEFTSVVSLAGRAGQAKRADFASTHARALEPKLARVRFDIHETAADLTLTVDGTAIAVDAVRTTAIPVDPGAHVVRAMAKAKLPWEGRLVVADGPSTAAFAVPSLAAAPVAPPFVAPSPSPASSPSGDATSANDLPSRTPPPRTLAYASAAASIVALAVGGVTGGLAISAQSRADRDCTGTVCRTPEGLDANDRAHTFATVSTIGFVAGGAFALTSLVLFLVAPRSSASAMRAARPAKPGFAFYF